MTDQSIVFKASPAVIDGQDVTISGALTLRPPVTDSDTADPPSKPEPEPEPNPTPDPDAEPVPTHMEIDVTPDVIYVGDHFDIETPVVYSDGSRRVSHPHRFTNYDDQLIWHGSYGDPTFKALRAGATHIEDQYGGMRAECVITVLPAEDRDAIGPPPPSESGDPDAPDTPTKAPDPEPNKPSSGPGDPKDDPDDDGDTAVTPDPDPSANNRRPLPQIRRNARGEAITPAPHDAPTGVAIREVQLEPGTTGDPVRVLAVERKPNGTVKNWPEMTVAPGVMVRINDGYDLGWLQVYHSAAGEVLTCNDILNTPADLHFERFRVIDPEGHVLYDDKLTVYGDAANVTWRYRDLDILRDYDPRVLPVFDPSVADMDATRWVHELDGRKDKAGMAFDGPCGTRRYTTGMRNTGPHPNIGGLDKAGAPLAAKLQRGDKRNTPAFKTALDNAVVMMDAFNVFPTRQSDPETLLPISIAKYPRLSTRMHFNRRGNPCNRRARSKTPISITQGIAHGPAAYIVIANCTNSGVAKLGLLQWANHQVAYQNEAYRQYDKGCLIPSTQLRGQAWGLRTMGAASRACQKYAGGAYSAYFDAHIGHNLDVLHRVVDRSRVPINPTDLGDAEGHRWSYSNFMGWFFTFAGGYLVDLGYKDWQDVASWLAELPVQQINGEWPELGMIYHPKALRDDGSLVVDWEEMVRETARINAQVRAAIQYATGTPELAAAGSDNNPRQPVNCPIGYPWQPDGFISNYRMALYAAVRLKVPGAVEAVGRFEWMMADLPDWVDNGQMKLSLAA